VLSHTAGTTQHGFKDFYVGDELPTLVEVMEGGNLPDTKKMDVDFIPGTKWRYSGGGYVIAQMAIEDHLGKPLAEIADEHLFTPLNLKNTTMIQPGEKGFPENAAKVHDSSGEIISKGLPVCPQTAPSGMWSTPTDMSLLIIEMQNALANKKTKVISPTVAKLVTRHILDGWSLGWAIFYKQGNRPWFSHGGANTGTGGHIFGTMEEGWRMGGCTRQFPGFINGKMGGRLWR